MTDQQFDRLARVLSGSRSRRQALAVLGALAAARVRSTHAASQIEIAACGESGAVCTLIKGCCTGLVCATSMINPAFGVCVAGEGGMLPVSDGIVVPTGDGITEELAQEVSAAAAGSTEAASALTTKDTEIQARKDARQLRESNRRTRVRANKTEQQNRKATHRTTRDTKRATRDTNQDNRLATARLNEEPQLELAFFPDEEGSEVLRVRNLESVSVALSRIESIKDPTESKTLSISMASGRTYLLVSDKAVQDAELSSSEGQVWTEKDVCPDGGDALPDGEGVYLTAAKSGATLSHRLAVLCGETVTTGSSIETATQPRKKRKKHQHHT